MAQELLIVQAPGMLRVENKEEVPIEAYQCPTCSLMVPVNRVDEQGQITDQRADPPRTCRRCGSPMDVTASEKFQDEMAAKEATPTERPKRQTVKI